MKRKLSFNGGHHLIGDHNHPSGDDMSTDSSSSSVFVSSQDASDTLGTSTSNTVSISSPLVRTLILPGRNSSLSCPPEVVNSISDPLPERRSPLAISLEHHGLLHHDLSSAFFQLKSPGNEAYPICSVTDFVSLIISRITFDLFIRFLIMKLVTSKEVV